MLRSLDRVLAWAAWGVAALVVVLLFAGPGLIGADTGAPTAPVSYSGGAKTTAEAKAQPRSLFVSNCGSCHTLAAAGTSGAIGPNLDDAKPDAARVREVVTSGTGAMPSFRGSLDDPQVAALAAYVASVAGQ